MRQLRRDRVDDFDAQFATDQVAQQPSPRAWGVLGRWHPIEDRLIVHIRQLQADHGVRAFPNPDLGRLRGQLPQPAEHDLRLHAGKRAGDTAVVQRVQLRSGQSCAARGRQAPAPPAAGPSPVGSSINLVRHRAPRG
jgi:hypothetical protein